MDLGTFYREFQNPPQLSSLSIDVGAQSMAEDLVRNPSPPRLSPLDGHSFSTDLEISSLIPHSHTSHPPCNRTETLLDYMNPTTQRGRFSHYPSLQMRKRTLWTNNLPMVPLSLQNKALISESLVSDFRLLVTDFLASHLKCAWKELESEGSQSHAASTSCWPHLPNLPGSSWCIWATL